METADSSSTQTANIDSDRPDILQHCGSDQKQGCTHTALGRRL